MFEWLKKIFFRSSTAADAKPSAPQDRKAGGMQEKPCRSCGKPVSYDPSWRHIPNYCPECKAKYRAEQGDQNPEPKRIRHRCRSCGRFFTFPSTVKHYPNYCRQCRGKFRAQKD